MHFIIIASLHLGSTIGTGESLGVTCNTLASYLGEQKYSQSFNDKEIGYEHRPDGPFTLLGSWSVFFNRWQVTAESDCSSSCGTGRRTRRVQCIKTVAMRRTIVVVDAHCSDQARPAEVVECHIECEMAHWEYSSWSQVCVFVKDIFSANAKHFCQCSVYFARVEHRSRHITIIAL